MGNPRLPDQVHILRGTFKPHRHGDPDEKIACSEEIGDPPVELDEIAGQEWHRVVTLFAGQGLLTAADRAPLAIYCRYWSQWCRDDLSATAVAQMRGIMRELGLFTPGQRCKLTRAKPKAEQNGFAAKPASVPVREAG